jgi:cell division protein FtsI (penicillin-binding protein 3)
MKKQVKKVKRKDLRQIAFTRFMLIVAFFILWMGGIGVRLVHLQVNQHDWLRERALGQRQDVKKSRMLRGTIYDRNKRALAMSVNVKTLYADPAEINDVQAAAKDIAKALKIDAASLLKQLKNGKEAGKRYIPIAKKIDESRVQKINKSLQVQDLKKADLPNYAGLHWTEDQTRSYPNGTLAANIIGFSNLNDEGQAGIEQSQNEILRGAMVKKIQDRDRLGRVYDETVSEREFPDDVVLTIDNVIQYQTEMALAEGVRAANAKSGTAIVIDQKTGDILALANYPTFDPGNLTSAKLETITDRAIQTVYSPGSVFKLVTYGSALEKNLITPDGQVDAGNGTIEVANHKFSDHHTGLMSYSEALAHSSNICAIKTGMRVGKTDFYSMVQRMGFGRKTGIELPAETGGIVRSLEKWNGDSLASMSIGYEIGVTALQMASAFATIANDGVRIQPHIIKEIRQQDDTVISAAQPEQTQVVSAETARSLRKMLRQVVLTGTGRKAQLNGYTSAGKTGTAWKFDSKTKRVESSKYVSSFIGFAPAENPAVTIAVVMDEPQVGARDGGMVSAPVFKQIAESILPELNVAQDSSVQPENNLTAENIPETPDNPRGLKKTVLSDAPDIKSDSKDKNTSSKPAKNVRPDAQTPERVKEVPEEKKDSADKKLRKDAAPPPASPKDSIKNKSSTEKAKPKT